MVRDHLPMIVVIGAALLLELTMGVMYYSAQRILSETMQRLVEREMNTIYLSIRNKLATVEVTMDNMAWIVTDDLKSPDSLMAATRQIVLHNPDYLTVCIPCVPNLFQQKGYWYEPVSIRRADGSIETKQVGSRTHDYTQKELFTAAIAKGESHWSEPYMDVDGANEMVTTYSVPVRDGKDNIKAVIGVDIALDWLETLMGDTRAYKSTQRYLVTGKGSLLAGDNTPTFQAAMKLLDAGSNNEGYEMMEDANGDKHHVFFHPVGGKTDWVLISVCNDNEVFGPLRSVRLTLLLLILTGLAILAFIVHRTSRSLARLRIVNAEKERISGELHVAHQIQLSMLPKEAFRTEDLELRGFLKPAREVGGDLYDYFVRDDKLFFCIGDVSGKGTPSALVMAVIHSLFRAFSAHENNPARVMQAINESACRGNDSNIFVTLFIGVLDLPTGLLRYCDAGHDAPFILIGEGKEVSGERLVMLPVQPHLPVGVFDDTVFAMQEARIAPGSTIFLYTDGLTEAKNAQRKQFGLECVESVMKQCLGLSPQEILAKVTESVLLFVKDAEQSDDLTMLAIRYTPQTFETMLSETLVLKNDVKEVARFSAFIKSFLGQLDMEKSLASQLRLAVEEAVVNVIDYAYPVGQEGEIEVQVMTDGKTLKAIVIDTGVAFDPTAKAKADTTLSAEDRQIGGLGILLVREFMDSINYERINNRNILTLTKKYNSL